MSSATTLLGALVALFDADATLAADFADTGGLWVAGVPEEKVALPCCALMQHDEVPSWVGPVTTVQEEGTFDFVVYAVGLDQAETLAQHIKDVFDPATTQRDITPPGDLVRLAFTGAVNGWVQRLGYRVRLVEYRSKDSVWVYEVTMPYEAHVGKTI